MAKWANDLIMDAALDETATGTRMFVCSAQPTDYADAASLALAEATLDSGDFSKSNGDTSGRKVTVAAQNGLLIDESGTATHVAIGRAADTTLLIVTTCTSQALVANGENTVNVPAFDQEIADPS